MEKIIFGFIIGCVVSFSGSSFAENIKEKIVSYYDHSYSLVIDGEKVNLKNSILLTEDNSSYLPLREVANILGYNVSYKAETKTIKLTESTSPLKTETDNSASTEYKKTQHKNLSAIIVNNSVYFDTKEYLDYIESLSPNNEIAYDDKNNLLVIKINNKEIEVPVDETVLHNGRRYIKETYYQVK